MTLRSRCFSTLALAAVFVAAANADDWRIYRKDAQRTGMANEKINLPLKEAWTWTSDRIQKVAALSTVVVGGDYAYFTTGPRVTKGKDERLQYRRLVCVEAKTGELKWAVPLELPRINHLVAEDVGPVISESGIVFAVDQTVINIPCPTRTFAVKAYSGDTGKLIAKLDIPIRSWVDRVFLGVGGDQTVVLNPESRPFT